MAPWGFLLWPIWKEGGSVLKVFFLRLSNSKDFPLINYISKSMMIVLPGHEGYNLMIKPSRFFFPFPLELLRWASGVGCHG